MRVTTNTQREFWVQKSPEQEWQTLKVSHPDYTDAVVVAARFIFQPRCSLKSQRVQRT